MNSALQVRRNWLNSTAVASRGGRQPRQRIGQLRDGGGIGQGHGQLQLAALVFFQALTELLPKQLAQAPRSIGFRLVRNQFAQESKGGTEQLSARRGNALALGL